MGRVWNLHLDLGWVRFFAESFRKRSKPTAVRASCEVTQLLPDVYFGAGGDLPSPVRTLSTTPARRFIPLGVRSVHGVRFAVVYSTGCNVADFRHAPPDVRLLCDRLWPGGYTLALELAKANKKVLRML